MDINARIAQYVASEEVDSQDVAAAVKRLADHYQKSERPVTPWDLPDTQVAYAAYYLPLNTYRLAHLLEEALAVGFFEGLSAFVDFGSGAGALEGALERTPVSFSHGLFVEPSTEARELKQTLFPQSKWNQTDSLITKKDNSKSVVFFANSLSEIGELPSWALEFEALALLEPADHVNGRRLLETRQKLIEKGYHVWAPCTHQGACPLLTQSKSDWCHTRLDWDPSKELQVLLEQLPFKNQTLTYSYVLLRRTPPPMEPNLTRVTGDELKEKGKSRQMICRGENREFLSWLKRTKLEPGLKRGNVLRLQDTCEQKNTEVRIGSLEDFERLR